MENRTRNICMSLLFFIIVIVMIIGGYIYTKDLMQDKNKPTNKENLEKIKDNRLDKEKDYVYYDNEEIISIDPEITFKDVYLNIEGADIINSTLKSENDEIRKSVEYLNEENKDESKTILYDETTIYSAKERNYLTYNSKDYVSLIINDLTFNCYDDFLITGIKSYIIDLKNGNIITNEELLKKFGVTNDMIIEKIGTRLDETQSFNGEIEVIKKEETLNSLFDSYGLYVDGGNLYITFIVKTNFVNYNDSIKLN